MPGDFVKSFQPETKDKSALLADISRFYLHYSLAGVPLSRCLADDIVSHDSLACPSLEVFTAEWKEQYPELPPFKSSEENFSYLFGFWIVKTANDTAHIPPSGIDPKLWLCFGMVLHETWMKPHWSAERLQRIFNKYLYTTESSDTLAEHHECIVTTYLHQTGLTNTLKGQIVDNLACKSMQMGVLQQGEYVATIKDGFRVHLDIGLTSDGSSLTITEKLEFQGNVYPMTDEGPGAALLTDAKRKPKEAKLQGTVSYVISVDSLTGKLSHTKERETLQCLNQKMRALITPHVPALSAKKSLPASRTSEGRFFDVPSITTVDLKGLPPFFIGFQVI